MTARSNIGIGPRLVRYGIAPDQKYLLDPFAVTYDQLVVNANMLAHLPSAMSEFLSARCRKQFIMVHRCFVWIGLESNYSWNSHVEFAGSLVGDGSEVDEVPESTSHSFC